MKYMGKCLAGCDCPYIEIKVCDTCFHKDVCGDKDYLTENECSSYCDNKKLKAALEKQVAKKMEPAKRLEADITIGRTIFRKGTSVLHKCPACGEYLPTDPYCRFCGQRLVTEVKK